MEDKQISKNFKLSEFIKSETADKNKIDNTPSEEIIKNIELLVTSLLQPLRDKVSYAFHINSGFRCDELNKKVNGSKTSAHLQGLAADITLGSKQLNKILYDEIRKGKYDFHQAINEKNYSWIHLGIKKDNIGNKHQMFNL